MFGSVVRQLDHYHVKKLLQWEEWSINVHCNTYYILYAGIGTTIMLYTVYTHKYQSMKVLLNLSEYYIIALFKKNDAITALLV